MSFSSVVRALLLISASLVLSSCTRAETRTHFNVCWSSYVGWLPWSYALEQGLVKKWADKYGITIDMVQLGDYRESVNQYTAGEYDACAMTNTDALAIPAASGVDSTAVIVGHFSFGSDGLVLKNKRELAEIKGQTVHLAKYSVGHYFLLRALTSVGLTERDITVVDSADASAVSAFRAGDAKALVTRTAALAELTALPESHLAFDSSHLPGEIIDIMLVNTEVLKASPELAKALVGAWYEVMALISADGEAADAAKTAMANASGTDLEGFNAALRTTRMFFEPADAVAFIESPQFNAIMQYVAEFSFEHALLGEAVADATFIGVETPAGVFGDIENVQLRFDPSFMGMAAQGKL